MEVWKIVFHSILEIFHSIPFWHLPYCIPKFPFRSIPFHFPFHSIPYHALMVRIGLRRKRTAVYRKKLPKKACVHCSLEIALSNDALSLIFFQPITTRRLSDRKPFFSALSITTITILNRAICSE